MYVKFQLSNINYHLYDITVRVVYRDFSKGLDYIDISCEPKGVYFSSIIFRANNQSFFIPKKISTYEKIK